MNIKSIKSLVIPVGGWKEQTVYLVDVSYNASNPIHRCLFYTGFLNGPDGGPGGYARLLPPVGDIEYPDKSPYYMRVVSEVVTKSDLSSGECRLPDDVIAEAAAKLVEDWDCPECDTNNDPAESECRKCGEPRP